MINFFKSRAQSFRYAFGGWWYVIRTQRNAWIHAIISIAVIGVSIWLRIDAHDWALIVIAIAMVWTAEFINTALEAIVDLTSPEQHELAKISKDVGASAVLIAAGSAAIIGLIILGPPLWNQVAILLK
jgi:diacylglycerol kinase